MSLLHKARRVGVAVALLGALGVTGCQPFDLSGNGGTTVAMAPLSFFMPSSGAVIGEARVLSVSGDGVDRATFELDGAAIFTDEVSPFEWTLDPAQIAEGVHVVGITVRQRGIDRSVRASVTLEAGAVSEPPAPPEEEPPVEEPPAAPSVQFVTPASGSTISAPTVLTVLGEGLTSVRFLVDAALQFNDTSAPFQWTLDPAAVAAGSRALRIEAVHAGGTVTHDVTLNVVAPSTPEVPSDVLTAIQTLQPGQWYEIPNSKIRPHGPSPAPGGDLRSAVGAWSSGAYDTKRDQYLVWGGGHADYAGNEIYAFSMKTFSWKRLTEPSAFWPGDPHNGADRGAHPDNAPISRHSYDYIDYLPTVDKFIVGGGAGIWRSGQFGDSNTYLFDFDTKTWSIKAADPSAGISTSAVGPDGRFWHHGDWGVKAVLSAFDPNTNTWTKYADFGGWLGYYRTSEIDPVNNKFIMVGNGETRVWDLNDPHKAGYKLSTSGDRGIESMSHPGVAYDPIAKKIVAWQGGSTVYSLDFPTARWTARQTTGRGTNPPTAANLGTNGRWRYVPSLNVFVVVNHVDENVFVYKN